MYVKASGSYVVSSPPPGYMGVPYYNTDMTSHPQYITVRNERGAAMLEAVAGGLEETATMSAGDRTPFVMSTLVQDDECVATVLCLCTACSIATDLVPCWSTHGCLLF